MPICHALSSVKHFYLLSPINALYPKCPLEAEETEVLRGSLPYSGPISCVGLSSEQQCPPGMASQGVPRRRWSLRLGVRPFPSQVGRHGGGGVPWGQALPDSQPHLPQPGVLHPVLVREPRWISCMFLREGWGEEEAEIY